MDARQASFGMALGWVISLVAHTGTFVAMWLHSGGEAPSRARFAVMTGRAGEAADVPVGSIHVQVSNLAVDSPREVKPVATESKPFSPMQVRPARAEFRGTTFSLSPSASNAEVAMRDPPAAVEPLHRSLSSIVAPPAMAVDALKRRSLEEVVAMQAAAAAAEDIPAPSRRVGSRASSQAGAATRSGVTFVENMPPIYPPPAVAARMEGLVLLRLTVDAEGRVSNVVVLQSSGHSILDAAAVQAVRHWRGRPAMENGYPVASEEILPVRFTLDQVR